MALVGEAHIVVRALTDKVNNDIKRGFSGIAGEGKKAGEGLGNAFTKGFNKNTNQNMFSRMTDGLKSLVPGAESARKKLQSLERLNYTLGTAIAVVIGGISSLVGGLAAVGGSAIGAAGSIAVLGNVFASFGMAMVAAKLALGGVGKALAALNKQGAGNAAAQDAAQREAAAQRIQDAEQNLADVIETNRQSLIDANNNVRESQLELNKALVKGQEEIQQLGFDAEDAALSESKAALELDKARETLARTQDLPPNSRARKEAQLAYQEAELNLRKAKDKSADLNKEQDRLARTGVAGTAAVISATQKLAQAEAAKAKAVRDALRTQSKAEEDLAKAKKAANLADLTSGGSDPFYGLTQSQIEFVKNLQSLKPMLMDLKESIAGAFLPPLWEAITTLTNGLFPTIKTGMTQIAASMGVAVKGFADMAVEGRNVALLGTLFESSSRIISQLGTTAGGAYGIALSLLNAAAPQAERFVGFLNTKLLSFDEYLKSDAGKAKVSDFFTKSGDAAAQFGGILGNTLGAIGNIVMANLGPGTGGQMMLDYLTQVTQGWQDVGTKGIAGVGSLSDYFRATADNAKSVLGAVGSLIGELLKLGANSAIGDTFDILKTGSGSLGAILKASVEAGPSLANLVVAILDIGKAFSGPGNAAISFLDTLTFVARTAADILNSELAQKIINMFAPIAGVVSAITLLGTGAVFAFEAIVGVVMKLTGALGMLGKAMTFLTKNPLILVIAALAAAFIYLYSTSEEFKNSINAVGAQIAGAFGEMVGTIMPAIMSLLPILANLITMLVTNLAPVFVMLAQLIGDVVAQLGPVLGTIIGSLIGMFGQLLTAITPLIPVIMGGLVAALQIITTVINQIFAAITPLIPVLLGAFQSILNAVLPLIPVLINALVPAFLAIIQAILPLIPILLNTLIPIIMQLIDAFMPLVPVLADLLVNALKIVLPIIVFLAQVLANILPPIVDIGLKISTFLIPIIIWLLDVFIQIVAGIIGIWAGFYGFIADSIQNFVKFWNEMWTNIGTFISDTWNNIVKFVTDAWNGLIGFLQPGLEAFFKFWSDIFTNVGNFISDTWNNIVKFFTDGWNIVVGWITERITNFLNVWIFIFQQVGGFISTVWNNIVKFFQDGWNTVVSWITTGINNFLNNWKYIFGLVGGFISTVWNNITNFFKDGWNGVVGWITGAINNFVTFWKNAFTGIGDFVGSVFNGIVGIIKGPINMIIDLINGMIGNINKVKIDIPEFARWMFGGQSKLSFSIPTIPRLAAGGIVSPSAGGTLAQIAEAGKPERVEPLDNNGMSKRDKYMVDLIKSQGAGNINITVNPSAGMNEAELASAISREITFQMRRGAVA